MKILLLEDLDTFYEAIRDGLATRFKDIGKVDIVRIASELEFRTALPRLVKEDFDVAIFDVMVGWCLPEEAVTEAGMNPPPEVAQELSLDKRWRSGVRCRRMFEERRAQAGARAVPCLYYSVLDPESLHEELNGETELVVKQGDIDSLVRAIKRAAGRK